MHSRDYRDVVGGALVALCGLFLVVHASANYTLGTLRVMGPGMFPLLVGWLMAAIGLVIVVPALFRAGPRMEDFELRPTIASLVAVLSFALIEFLGLIAAVMAVTVIATMADDKLGVTGKLLLGIALAALCVAIFTWALGLQMPALPRFF